VWKWGHSDKTCHHGDGTISM